jgi:hypothetical protein
MLHAPSLRRAMVQMGNFGLLAGTVMWILLVVHGAQRVSSGIAVQEYLVRFGPLNLTHIVKKPITGGFIANLSLETGLLWYIIGWIAAGAAAGWLLVILANKRPL